MPGTELAALLDRHRQLLDRETEAARLAAERNNTKIYCGKGCGNCCTLAVNCSFPEAAAIAAGLSEEQRQQLAAKIPLLQQLSRNSESLKEFLRGFRKRIGACPFLDIREQSCTIYPLRPLSCRALLATRPADWCGVDFSELHPLEKQAFMSALDPDLVAFPTHYLAAPQDLAAELESDLNATLRETRGTGLTGNMIYLVWLALKHNLEQVFAGDAAEAQTFLEQPQINLPYLLQIG